MPGARAPRRHRPPAAQPLTLPARERRRLVRPVTAGAASPSPEQGTEPDVFLYGEDIYGVHSIEYDPVPEDRTFYAFALRLKDGSFGSFHEMTEYATTHAIPVVPVLFEGTFDSVQQVRDLVSDAHAQPSALGGEREGVVLRLAAGFPAAEFPRSVCKSVRVGHVQSDEHWSKRWRPCRIAR